MTNSHERTAQKRRTREAILAGARELLGEGATVTVAEAAKRQGISRATAYRYFQDPAALAAEAGLAVEVDDYATVVDGAETVRDKLLAINLYMIELTLENEVAFRQFLSKSLDATSKEKNQNAHRRGARRTSMYEEALEPVLDHIGHDVAQRLKNALAATTGVEALVALMDVAGVEKEAVQGMVGDMTAAILDKFLDSDDG
jgi:AcrR family transcriptional regulator